MAPRLAFSPSLDLDYAGSLKLPGDARLALLGKLSLVSRLLLPRAVNLKPKHLPAQLRKQFTLLKDFALQPFACLPLLKQHRVTTDSLILPSGHLE